MAEIEFKARAKINLTLDVLARLRDGYHLVEMVMQQIDLADRVRISTGSRDGPVRVVSDNPHVPDGRANIAFRAAQLIRERCGTDRAVTIFIQKSIPTAAGLGGGSTDAAAVILGLNCLFGLNMDLAEMMRLGSGLGADVPFCIMGGTALARGRGEILTPLYSAAILDILLVKPRFSVSTAWAYQNLDISSITNRPDNAGMIAALETGDKERIASGMVNVLEGVTASRYKEILEIKSRMMERGALGVVMSGSGPTVVGLFGDGQRAKEAAKIFMESYKKVIVTKTVPTKEGE
ncbi:MAG: 4-(cytidine 5'-diphospho)-2-C-methyl-D-erythritol kinase [Bacillota bacterium]|nr:4-(cytidine 5'-diphospho)-2-C-methyl-D-erythritol kinase [Bacillota bacterium]MDD3297416.1 4-(cytidine 5'-diphospho)-2-C-methyl-D-erythritol kinase [Bacillota bacterium]MDD3851177.1 4-(cytidine 5'-diphospho)-2-C-methyl-D-erythritol kinase [Bacillota bacterium]MDD4707185.1 4-(cytidine 5'-diphospho)-2-C-methyl-D-erythritol kinase [Bacillota bacterium]